MPIEATLRLWVTGEDDQEVDRVIAAIEQTGAKPFTGMPYVVVTEQSRREVDR